LEDFFLFILLLVQYTVEESLALAKMDPRNSTKVDQLGWLLIIFCSRNPLALIMKVHRQRLQIYFPIKVTAQLSIPLRLAGELCKKLYGMCREYGEDFIVNDDENRSVQLGEV
jgi:hypothetical protein